MNVAAGVFYKDGRVLLMRRAARLKHGGGWEYPGGKLEAGESGEVCVKRELFEELGVVAFIGELLAEVSIPIPNDVLRLSAYRVLDYSGEIWLTDHDAMEWVPLEKLVEHDQLPADLEVSKQVVAKLRVF